MIGDQTEIDILYQHNRAQGTLLVPSIHKPCNRFKIFYSRLTHPFPGMVNCISRFAACPDSSSIFGQYRTRLPGWEFIFESILRNPLLIAAVRIHYKDFTVAVTPRSERYA